MHCGLGNDQELLVLAAPLAALDGNIQYDHVDVLQEGRHRIAFEHFFTSLEPAIPRSFSGLPRRRNEARRGCGSLSARAIFPVDR